MVHMNRDPAHLKLYPSEAGKCARMIQYKAMGVPGEPMLADVQFKLAMGNLVELALMYVIECTPGVRVIENNVIRDIVIAGRPWRGATDGIHIDKHAKRRNLEIKSASAVGFKMTVQKGIDDNFGYLTQASVYVRSLLAAGHITEPETIFVYVDRDSMKLWETVVRYDPALAKAADDKFERIIAAIEAKKILPRPYVLDPGNKLGLNCRYCSHKMTCWTAPSQVVTFKGQEPVYRLPPTERVDLEFGKGSKPSWVVRAV
jgi:hypothetical protein